jgi:hypothetical protein
MVWVCNTHGIDEKFVQKYVGNLKVKGPRGKPRRRWEDNFRMDAKVTG